MSVPFHTAPKVGIVQTVGAVTSTVVQYDLSSATEALGAMDDKQITANCRLLGRQGGNVFRADRLSTFTRISGTVAQIDTPVQLGQDLISAALSGSAITLDFTGNVVRVRALGVAALTINWTGYLWLFTSD